MIAQVDTPHGGVTTDRALAQLDTATHALAECKTVMEAKQIADVAEAARIYLRRTHASEEAVSRAAEIRELAVRQMGEFLKEMPKATGARGVGTSAVPEENRTPTLADIGVTKKQSATAQKLAAIPEPEFKERIAVLKASGETITSAKIIKDSFYPSAKAAGEAAERDSENLWKLKSLWKKCSKRDRAAFLAWTQIQ